MKQDLRFFLEEIKNKFPEDVKYIKDEVSTKYEITAIMMELEKKGSPLTIFENVKNNKIPVVSNILASRKRLSQAFGIEDEREFIEVYSKYKKRRIEPGIIDKKAFEGEYYNEDSLDLNNLPILTHFNADGGPYITAGLVVARDPDSGIHTCGLHRLQLKGKDKLGISLHSRKRMWEFHRRAEEKGGSLPAAIAIGVHPVITMGSLSFLPYNESKYDLIGGLFGEQLQVVKCKNIDVLVPAWSEIVIEGEILNNVREPEGPFSEFSNYLSGRSTENVFKAKSLYLREDTLYQSINPGLSADHNTIMAYHRECDIFYALRRTLPNVKDVHFPISGCGIFSCYVSIKKTAEGEPLQAIFAVLAADHCIKTVVVVDEDIDVFNEQQILWAISTRLQADRDIIITPQNMGMGDMLDPSADELYRSSKIGIDSTKPLSGFPKKIEVSEEIRRKILPIISKIDIGN